MNTVQYGGTVAAPIAKSVFESAISILEIQPSEKGMEKEYNHLDQKYVKVPNVVGFQIEEAKKTLKGFQVEYTGVGERILYQSPSEGEYVKEGGTIKVYLG